MRIGALDRRVTIETLSTAQDASGAAIETWTKLADVWAQVIPLRGRALLAAGELAHDIDATFRIRWRSGLVAGKVRVIFDGLTYEVTRIAELGRRAGLELSARALI